MKRKSLLDSFAILALLKKEDNYHVVLNMLNEAKDGKRQLIMNQMNAGEVYYEVVKRGLTEDFDKFWRTFLMLPIVLIGNDFADVIEAAKIKSRYAVSFADCFAAATAIREKAEIVTGDPEFKKLEEQVDIVWI